MTNANKADLVKTALQNLGRPSFLEIATAVKETQSLSKLLRRNRLVLSHDDGREWLVGETYYDIDCNCDHPREIDDLIEHILVSRAEAMIAMLPVLEELFVDVAGEGADPSEWQAVLTTKRWLTERVELLANGVVRVWLNCAVFFEKPINEAGLIHSP